MAAWATPPQDPILNPSSYLYNCETELPVGMSTLDHDRFKASFDDVIVGDVVTCSGIEKKKNAFYTPLQCHRRNQLLN